MQDRYPHVDVVAFGPHPDDVEMGCGGTLVKLKKAGYSLGVVDLTKGEMGTRGSEEIRSKEASRATGILGIDSRINLGLPDGKLWNTDSSREKVVKIIRQMTPEIVIAAHWLDDHPDHVQGAYLVKDSFYMSGFKNLFPEYEYHRPKAIMYYMCRREFEPTFIVDITDEFEQKMESVKSYRSQFLNEDSDEPQTPLSHPDFLDMFTARAKFYGRKINCRFGEPFYTKNPPPVEDPVAIWK